MSRRSEFFVILAIVVPFSILLGWSMNPGNTPLHDWIAPSIGENGIWWLRQLIVGIVAMASFQLVKIWRPRQGASPTSHGRD